jgi:hypothetical protein
VKLGGFRPKPPRAVANAIGPCIWVGPSTPIGGAAMGKSESNSTLVADPNRRSEWLGGGLTRSADWERLR